MNLKALHLRLSNILSRALAYVAERYFKIPEAIRTILELFSYLIGMLFIGRIWEKVELVHVIAGSLFLIAFIVNLIANIRYKMSGSAYYIRIPHINDSYQKFTSFSLAVLALVAGISLPLVMREDIRITAVILIIIGLSLLLSSYVNPPGVKITIRNDKISSNSLSEAIAISSITHISVSDTKLSFHTNTGLLTIDNLLLTEVEKVRLANSQSTVRT